MAKRQFIFEQIRKVFQKFGFQPLETPAMENLSTLTGKYGDEGDQLLFRILKSGDFIDNYKKAVNLVLHTSGTDLRELFDAVYQKILETRSESLEEVENLVVEEIQKTDFRKKGEAKLFLKDIILQAKSQVASQILNWRAKILIGETHLEQIIDYYQSRNEYVSELILSLQSINTFYESFLLRNRISEKGLRYDLTVPFARYVVMNRHEVSFPFKRYQIQPVWRADRPQKGRYQEFYQCDADVVGTDSLICEAEIILMIKEVFNELNIRDYTIKINHRGILSGLAEMIDAPNETALFVAIDKLDKIGEEGVRNELRSNGFNDDSLGHLFNILNTKGSIINKLAFLTNQFDNNVHGQKGLRDLREVFDLLNYYYINDNLYETSDDHVEFDVALARGLSYYTGCIFEVKINNVAIGSVSGGGRYDNLTQAFGDKDNLSGVGFSFGVDRIYDAMEELSLFPKGAQVSSKVLVCHFDSESMRYGLGVLTKLRAAGVAAEIYPDPSKIKKQLDYANKKMIPFTIVIGSDEMSSGLLAFKNMESGVQEKLTIDQILQQLK
jgi:histidyl-tRNA synthetase